MNGVLIAGTVVLAVAIAIRSTWSPCGLSMLSTVTPLAERGRGHRYAVTAAWFIAGAAAGGATLGAGAALLAAAVSAFDPSSLAISALAALAATVALASDVQLFGFRLPAHTRQVDEVWLGKYRAWVYGAGFGWQIGVGLATYIMTAGVYLMIVLAALTTSPLAAFVIATLFGTLRGLAVLLGAHIESPDDLFAFHRRFDAVGPYARMLVIAVEGALAFVALALCTTVVVASAGAIVVACVAYATRPAAAVPTS